jgi:Peptidase propeptide and YPEB domain
MELSRFAAAVVMTASIGIAVHALGQTTTAPTTPSQSAGAALSIPEVVERLSRQGYSDVGEVKRKSDRLYKVKARDAQRRTQEMSVDARTAEVLASEQDDDDD